MEVLWIDENPPVLFIFSAAFSANCLSFRLSLLLSFFCSFFVALSNSTTLYGSTPFSKLVNTSRGGRTSNSPARTAVAVLLCRLCGGIASSLLGSKVLTIFKARWKSEAKIRFDLRGRLDCCTFTAVYQPFDQFGVGTCPGTNFNLSEYITSFSSEMHRILPCPALNKAPNRASFRPLGIGILPHIVFLFLLRSCCLKNPHVLGSGAVPRSRPV